MIFCKLALTLAFTLLPIQTSAGTIPAGDYTGWAYETSGSDFPMRLRCEQLNDAIRCTLIFPHLGIDDLLTTAKKSDDGSVILSHSNRDGSEWEYRIVADGSNYLTGTASFDGEIQYKFELHRSGEPLEKSLPPNPGQYTGIYRGESGRSLIISKWPWGELRMLDTLSGRSGTLLQTPSGDLILGSAIYVADPVAARLRFVQQKQTGDRVVFTPTDGKPESLNRIQLLEEDFSFTRNEIDFHGTIVRLPSDDPQPAMVILGGSNWRDREKVRREAEIFASFGIACLIYDKRGHGESGGDEICSFAETASDAATALNKLRQHRGVDPSRVGVLGMSRGGWLAPLAAGQVENIAFTILFVAPAVSPAEQEHTRRLNLIRQTGFQDPDVRDAEVYLQTMWKATNSQSDWERYETLRDQMADRQWFSIADQLTSADSDDYRWCKLNMHYNPVPAMEQLTGPVLALFGERDENVTPVQNVPVMRRAFESCGNDDATIKVIPQADHSLWPVDENHTEPMFHRSTGYAPEVWSTIRQWLSDHNLMSPDIKTK